MGKNHHLICYVGKNLAFGNAAIKILLDKHLPILAIVGETADFFYESLCQGKTRNRILVINKKSPWQESLFTDLFKNDVIGLNCGIDYMIPKDVLMQHPIVNTHPAALPFNRGCHHSFWGIINKTPLGATIHWMTDVLDQGPIINQKIFKDDGLMTAEEIQNKSNLLCLELIEENIENIIKGRANSTPQGEGTYHSKKDIVKASTLDINDSISVQQLLDLCRATCNKENGFIIDRNGQKIKCVIKKVELIP